MGTLALLLALAATLDGKVIAIADGDTLTVLDSDNVRHRIRIHGIDAPERGQSFGTKSKESMSAMAFGKQATCDVVGTDRYKRTVATVMVGGVNVGLRQVESGMAWHFRKYAANDAILAKAERDARDAKRGLWSQEAIEPWRWRRERAAR